MTRDDLAAWITRRALTQDAAADMLGLTRRGLQDQLYGVHPISRQTEIICRLWDLHAAAQVAP